MVLFRTQETMDQDHKEKKRNQTNSRVLIPMTIFIDNSSIKQTCGQYVWHLTFQPKSSSLCQYWYGRWR